MNQGFINVVLRITLVLQLCVASAASASVRDADLSGLSCAACHSVGARLNDIGNAWAAQSNRLEPIGDIPLISAKASIAYLSDGNGPGLAKTVVNYLDLYLNGKIAPQLTYVVQQHIVDGGAPGFNHEAFVLWRRARSRYLAGAMSLPLLTDPERFRALDDDYLVDTQTVANNPFALIESHPMAGFFSGDSLRGMEIGAFAVAGHEAGSGVAQRSTDSLFSATRRTPHVALSVIRYDGTRVLGSTIDRFWRSAYQAVLDRGPWRLDFVFARGRDSDPGTGRAIRSGGGLALLHFDLDERTFAEARYEGIGDMTGLLIRQAVVGAGRRIGANARLTIEDGIARDTRTHNVLHMVAEFGASNTRVAGTSY